LKARRQQQSSKRALCFQFETLHTYITSSNLKIGLEVPKASGKLVKIECGGK